MTVSFRNRIHQQELLDDTNIPKLDIYKNMQELAVINKLLGGHHTTLAGVKKLIQNKTTISICEIGCGGGDNLKYIHQWATNNNINVILTGIDYNPHCIAFAKQHQKFACNWIQSDYCLITTKFDIIFNSLFCHHFSTQNVKNILQHMYTNSKVGFFINDLHRHPLAYYSIKLLTTLFSSSYLVKNDAPLSVLNGFTKQEWQDALLQTTPTAIVKWRWAFRHLIYFRHEQ
jgi:2-polyprenyl-3-methyl-5-hydroxy-6-metoxy-1,4-benzoquinol methylase